MRLNTMSFSKCLLAVLGCCACAVSHATEPHRYVCPSPLLLGNFKHVLKHVEVYDGPPKNMASLEAWGLLKNVDVYLVCTYDGTDKDVTIHAVGSASCNSTDKPRTAFCD
jgi:hypothetical protein